MIAVVFGSGLLGPPSSEANFASRRAAWTPGLERFCNSANCFSDFPWMLLFISVRGRDASGFCIRHHGCKRSVAVGFHKVKLSVAAPAIVMGLGPASVITNANVAPLRYGIETVCPYHAILQWWSRLCCVLVLCPPLLKGRIGIPHSVIDCMFSWPIKSANRFYKLRSVCHLISPQLRIAVVFRFGPLEPPSRETNFASRRAAWALCLKGLVIPQTVSAMFLGRSCSFPCAVVMRLGSVSGITGANDPLRSDSINAALRRPPGASQPPS